MVKDSPEYKRLQRRHERDAELLEDAEHNVRTLQRKLTISASLVEFQNEAYDALLIHGVDYRKCRVWNEASNPLLDTKTRMTEKQAMSVLTHWLGRMVRDLRAAIKRKSIKEVKK